MENKPTTSNAPRIAALLAVSAVVYYFFTRRNITVCDLDETTRSVSYKVELGFKTIEGEISALNPSGQEHKFFNKTLTIVTNQNDTITFTITNDKGEIMDEVVHSFADDRPFIPVESCQR